MSLRAFRRARGEPATLLVSINLSTIALGCDIVGIIFLANSLNLRDPRRFLNEHFGVARRQPLRAVHQQLRNKAQIFTGFLFLMLGFSLAIVSEVFGFEEVAETLTRGEQVRSVTVLVLGILAVSVLLRMAQNAWSLKVFRRLLAEFFEEHSDWNFEKHPSETRDIGEILGVAHHGDDSIADYAQRVRAALQLDHDPAHRHGGDDAFAPLRNVGNDRRR